jgi:serine/threonine-protein kinase
MQQPDIGMMSMEGSRERKALLQEKHWEWGAQISPDGRYMAYQSDESGKMEIFVRTFPDVNKDKWPVSSGGGNSPLWNPDGRELFYRSGDETIAVAVETEPTFKRGNSRVLFRGTYLTQSLSMASPATQWDIHPKEKKFLMIKPPASAGAASADAKPQQKIIVVLNWTEELKRLATAK